MNEREFWIQIRRGLIYVIDAIDQRYALNHIRRSEVPVATLGSNHQPVIQPDQPSPERTQ